MNWQLLALTSAFFYSIVGLLQKSLLREQNIHPLAFSILFQFGVALLIGLFGFLFSDMRFPNLTALWPNLVLMVIFYSLMNVFIFKSLKQTDVSTFAILFSTRIFFTAIPSALIFHQGLGLKQLLGTLLIISGIVLINMKNKTIKFTRGEIYALLAAVCIGLAFTNDKVMVNKFSVYAYTFTIFILPAGAMLMLAPKLLPKMKFFVKVNNLIKLLAVCLFHAIAIISLYWGLQISPNISQLTAINITSVIITVILSIIFLKERHDIFRKIIAAVLSFIGLLLVS